MLAAARDAATKNVTGHGAEVTLLGAREVRDHSCSFSESISPLVEALANTA
jgi:hypothetical protein